MATKKKAAATAKKTAKKKVAPKSRALQPKQQMFVDEYLIDLNATQAAIRAGYSIKTAHSQGPRLLENVAVAAAIKAAMKARSEKTNIDAAWVLNSAKDLFERCMQVSQVMKNGEMVLVETPQGDVKPAFTFDSSGAGKALDIIGKHVNVQAFNEKSTVHHVDKDGNDMTWTVQVVDSTKATA